MTKIVRRGSKKTAPRCIINTGNAIPVLFHWLYSSIPVQSIRKYFLFSYTQR